MIGRDLIIYILKNNLEDEPIFKDGKLIGFITVGEAAAKMGVGVNTIYAWVSQNRLDYVYIGNECFISDACELIGGNND